MFPSTYDINGIASTHVETLVQAQAQNRSYKLKKAVLYIHGKGGTAAEAEHYRPLFPDCEVIGFDYVSQTPWEAKAEFPAFFDEHCAGYDAVTLIANSIGAFFAMSSLGGRNIKNALLISPIVDMQRLITDMMGWANVSETQLREEKEIPTDFGETLSWEYLCYVREHPISWRIPTEILYGGRDNLTSRRTVEEFAAAHGAGLCVMENGEHWFHTPEQMEFLDDWVKSAI